MRAWVQPLEVVYEQDWAHPRATALHLKLTMSDTVDAWTVDDLRGDALRYRPGATVGIDVTLRGALREAGGAALRPAAPRPASRRAPSASASPTGPALDGPSLLKDVPALDSAAGLIDLLNRRRAGGRLYIQVVSDAPGRVTADREMPALPPSVLSVLPAEGDGDGTAPLSERVWSEVSAEIPGGRQRQPNPFPEHRTMKPPLLLPALALALLSVPAPAPAVEPQEVVYDSYADFALGTTRSTALSDQGLLTASPALDPLAVFGPEQASQVWAVVPAGGNAFYAATSPKGTVFRVTPGGRVETAAKFPETHVYALARNAKGDLFAATSPDGKIYRVQDGGKFEVWFDPKAKYVWALAFDKAGDLYAATGTEGKIYKVTGQNKGSVFYASDETHIRSLAFDKAGNLLAGSAENGLLYRIAPDGTAVVLAATGRQEVNRIAVADDGTVWFAATGAPRARAGGDAEAKGPPRRDSPPPSPGRAPPP